jgi:hypothetical protein
VTLCRHNPEQESALVCLEVIEFIEALGAAIPTEEFSDFIQSFLPQYINSNELQTCKKYNSLKVIQLRGPNNALY